eukprot:94957-Pelagomonas_calceolata.AAC.6
MRAHGVLLNSLQVLEKTYLMMTDDEGVLEKAEGTKIDWKAGPSLDVDQWGASSTRACVAEI